VKTFWIFNKKKQTMVLWLCLLSSAGSLPPTLSTSPSHECAYNVQSSLSKNKSAKDCDFPLPSAYPFFFNSVSVLVLRWTAVLASPEIGTPYQLGAGGPGGYAFAIDDGDGNLVVATRQLGDSPSIISKSALGVSTAFAQVRDKCEKNNNKIQ
jgi:hypothetical protein